MAAVGTGSRIEGWSVSGDDDRVFLIRRQTFEAVASREAASVLWTARAIVSQCPSKDDRCELEAIYTAVTRGPLPILLDGGQVITVPGIRFVTDPRWTDTYPTAHKILQWAAQGSNGEDCDGHVILIDSLLLVLGWLPGVVIASKDGREFQHIFPVAGFPKEDPKIWVPLDTTVREASVGWWPPRGLVRRMRVYALTGHPHVVGREIL